MAKTILSDVTMIYGSEDISGETNNLSLDFTSAEQSTTNFRSGGAEEYIPGLQSADWSFKGLRDSNALGTFVYSGRRNRIPVVAGLGLLQTPGDGCYAQETVYQKYSEMMVVGETHKYELALKGCRPTHRGVILDYQATASADGSTAGITRPAVLSAQKVIAILLVESAPVSGGALDLVLETDGDNTFGTPATRITFAQMTTTGYQVVELSGAIADTAWRSTREVAGGAFRYRIFLAIE